MATGGFDTDIYAEYLKEQFGLVPLNIYGSTEAGYSLAGPPDRKRDLMPFLNSCYFEFVSDDGEIRKIDELEKSTERDLWNKDLNELKQKITQLF